MINTLVTKISLYLKIGLLILIIVLLAFIGFQFIRIKSLEKNIDNLKIKNEVLIKEKQFFDARIKILSDFTNSTKAIEAIRNELVFDSEKQKAIDNILEDFYKE